VTKLHVVRKPRDGLDRWYVYAWRGGPCIHMQDGARPVIGPELLDKQSQERMRRAAGGERTLDRIVDAYRASPEFLRLEPSTQRDYRLWLDRISERFGPAPIGAFADSRMREQIINWRDRWSSQPRTADKAAVMMATLLSWAVERGIIAVNVAAGIKLLHSVNKAEKVWERRHMRSFALAPKHLRNALKLAGMTGLRLGDLVQLDWSNVGDRAIIVTTRKRGGRAVIPIVSELRRLLDKLAPEDRKGAVLRNSRGQGWTESGLGSVFQKAKPKGFDRTMHDLRGTYATWLAMKGLTDEEIARVIGWTAKKVGEIRARYVDEARVIVSLVERLSA
jgi:integrase